MFKGLTDQDFGEVVGALVSGIDFDEVKLVGMGPKPVPLVQVIAGPVGDVVVGCKDECTLIIFKDSGANGGRNEVWNFEDGTRFNQHAFEGQEGLEGVREGIVLGFQGGA